MGCKMKVTTCTLAILLLLLTAGLAKAGPYLEVQVDRTQLTTHDYATLTVIVKADHCRLVLPRTRDFIIERLDTFFDQPIMCMNIGLRVMSGPCVFKFRLYPKHPGKLTLPSIKLVGEFFNAGRLLDKSDPIQFQVKKGTGKKRKKGRRNLRLPGTIAGTGELKLPPDKPKTIKLIDLKDLSKFSKYDMFLVPKIDEDKIYPSQPFVVDFLLYIGDDVAAQQIVNLELPELQNFRKERLEVQQNSLGEVTVGGKNYSVYLLDRYVLIPLVENQVTIASAKATVSVAVSQVIRRPGGFSISITTGGKEVDVVSPPVEIQLAKFPQGAPAGFNVGNVGEFEIADLQVPPPRPAGSWLLLKYIIKGKGNLFGLSVPTLKNLPDTEIKEPNVDTSGVVVDKDGVHGTVVVQIPFRLKRQGSYDFPPLRLVYFDPWKERYVELKSKKLELVATKPKQKKMVSQVRAIDIEGVVVEGAVEAVKGKAWPEWVWAGLIAPPILFALLAIVRLITRLSARDKEKMLAKKAYKEAKRALNAASEALKQGNREEFYSNLAKYLYGVIEAKFGIAGHAMTLSQLKKELERRGVDSALANRVVEEFEGLDFARFAPASKHEEQEREELKQVKELAALLNKTKVKKKKKIRRNAVAILLLFSLVQWSSTTLAAQTEQEMKQAAKLYVDGKYEQALDKYLDLLKELKSPGPAIYYNIGNCHYKLGEYGKAVYYYRKAQQFSMDSDLSRRVEKNLAAAKKALKQRYKEQIEKGSIAYRDQHGIWYAIFTFLGRSTVQILFLLFWILLFGSLSVLLFVRKGKLNYIARIVAFSSVVPALVFCVLLLGRYWVDKNYKLGVVVSQQALVLDTPDENSPGYPVAEGVEVRVLDNDTPGYFRVQIGENRIGYMPEPQVWLYDQEPEVK